MFVFVLVFGLLLLALGSYCVLKSGDDADKLLGLVMAIGGSFLFAISIWGLCGVNGNEPRHPAQLAVSDTLYVVPRASLEGLAIMTDETGQLTVRRFTARHVVPSVLKQHGNRSKRGRNTGSQVPPFTRTLHTVKSPSLSRRDGQQNVGRSSEETYLQSQPKTAK